MISSLMPSCMIARKHHCNWLSPIQCLSVDKSVNFQLLDVYWTSLKKLLNNQDISFNAFHAKTENKYHSVHNI